ncbi:MAG: homoserine O-succinyltransferase [Gammaproteobacteria bacterium]|nr:homoserine O-succinyltransferase [Gammaproteobacteria bacterium]
MLNLSSSNHYSLPIQGNVALPAHFPLKHGGTVSDGKVAYSIYGDLQQPTVLILGGISASKDVAHKSGDYSSGWWDSFVGSEQVINTREYSVLSIDYLGGNGASSNPNADVGTPEGAVSTSDQARALAIVLNQLNISQLFAAIGSSYGGMVILSLLQQYPELTQQALVISAADKAHPQSSGLRFIQRQIVQECGAEKGLALARALAMITYRSPEEFEQRFGAYELNPAKHFSNDLTSYLLSRGRSFAECFNSDAFLRLSESIDLHRVDASKIETPLTCISVVSDQLIPAHTIKHMAQKCGANFQSIDSLYGHDAFLKETEKLNVILHSFLANQETNL